jgi:hypothetical protein
VKSKSGERRQNEVRERRLDLQACAFVNIARYLIGKSPPNTACSGQGFRPEGMRRLCWQGFWSAMESRPSALPLTQTVGRLILRTKRSGTLSSTPPPHQNIPLFGTQSHRKAPTPPTSAGYHVTFSCQAEPLGTGALNSDGDPAPPIRIQPVCAQPRVSTA